MRQLKQDGLNKPVTDKSELIELLSTWHLRLRSEESDVLILLGLIDESEAFSIDPLLEERAAACLAFGFRNVR